MYYKRIKDLGIDNDLTQNKLAKILNTTQQQYSKYETDIQEIPTRHLILLADFYQTSTGYILGRTNDKKPYKK